MPCATFTPLLFVPGRVEALTLTAAAQQSVSNAERLPWGFGWRLRLTAGCTVRTHVTGHWTQGNPMQLKNIWKEIRKKNVQKTSKTSELSTQAIFLVITDRLSTQNLCLLHYQLGLPKCVCGGGAVPIKIHLINLKSSRFTKNGLRHWYNYNTNTFNNNTIYYHYYETNITIVISLSKKYKIFKKLI